MSAHAPHWTAKGPKPRAAAVALAKTTLAALAHPPSRKYARMCPVIFTGSVKHTEPIPRDLTTAEHVGPVTESNGWHVCAACVRSWRMTT